MVRRGVLGLLLLCVPQILGGGDAKDRSPRRGRGSVRDSAVKSADEDRVQPSDAEELTRFRVATSDGVLVIYDAAIPPGGDQNRERERPAKSDNPGFVAYWHDFATESLYVFDRLLFTPDDVAVAVGSLQRDFVLDPASFASDDLGVSRIPSIPPATFDDGSWRPASRELVLAVMGFAAAEEGVGGVAGTIWGCPRPEAVQIGPMPAPPRRASPDVLLQLAIASAQCGGSPCTGCCAMNCADSDPCTSDWCVDGVCGHGPLTGPACASDGNRCTADICRVNAISS